MTTARRLARLSTLFFLALAAVACSSPGQMSDKQREGVEMRRFCERNPQEVEKCNGFLGFL
jgi:hypothetical protein